MKSKIGRVMAKILSAILVIVVLVSMIPMNGLVVYADDTPNSTSRAQDKMVVVSLGDSYSSGEGIEPFYGQEKESQDKVQDRNWLAHRSTKSWPGQLEIPGIDGTLSDYWSESEKINSDVCEWYFEAVSGAETKHITDSDLLKEYRQPYWNIFYYAYVTGGIELKPQINIFSRIDKPVDYVTMTIGGNDVGFVEIIKECAIKSTYLKNSELKKKLDKIWADFDKTEENIQNTYMEVVKKAGEQAKIIVAGYPKLLDKNGGGAHISKKEATLVNDSVSRFNDRIEGIVNALREKGISIYFVDVEEEFDGHEAYTDDQWINDIDIGAELQDLDVLALQSDYCIHPNEKGAKAYARCVNAKIRELEEYGEISGRVCKASDRVTPIKGATVMLFKDGITYMSKITDENGNYHFTVPKGEYQIYIYATDYISFKAYATVTRKETTYMETFLMIAGDRFSSGIATGTVKNALTGNGVGEVKLSIRDGWNNLNKETVLQTVYTDTSGNYSVNLPYGNYTVVAEKEGFVTALINIIVQRGTTSSQDGTISPIARVGDEYRIVLTWGANPNDLDSHMFGEWSNNNSFHVFYSCKSSYGVGNEKCYLDVDDTTSYGPETITFIPAEGKKYYYYIHRYAGIGTLANSEAKINVYRAGELIATFNVPTNLGEGIYWNVFAIENGQIIPKNTITDTLDTSY